MAYASETVAGVAPANAAAWVAAGQRCRHIADSLDLSPFKQQVIDDERAQENVNDWEQHIKGIKGGGDIEFPHATYLHGNLGTFADGTQVPATILSNLLENCFGGQSRSTGDTVAAGGVTSTLVIEATTSGEFPVGSWLGVVDSEGNEHKREVTAVAAGGVGEILTLHRALDFTPADGANIHPCIVIYEDEDVLEDSGSSGRTFSWLLERGRGSQSVRYQAMGCKSYLTGIELARGSAPKLQFSTKVGGFQTPEAAPDPTWVETPYGSAGRAIGPNTRVFMQDVGTVTDNRIHCSEFSAVPGVVPIPVPVQTSSNAGMEGLCAYSLERAKCMFSLTACPSSTSYWTDFNAQTHKHVQFERLAPPGIGWSLYFPNAEIEQGPTEGANGNLLVQPLSFHARRPSGTGAIGTARMKIVL